MEKSTYEDVLYEVDGPAAVITINREDRLNAFRGQGFVKVCVTVRDRQGRA